MILNHFMILTGIILLILSVPNQCQNFMSKTGNGKTIVKWENKCNHFHHNRNHSSLRCYCNKYDGKYEPELNCKQKNGQSLTITDELDNKHSSKLKFHCKGIITEGSFNTIIYDLKRINFEESNPTEVEVRSCPISSFFRFLTDLKVSDALEILTIRIDFPGQVFNFSSQVFSSMEKNYPNLTKLAIVEGGKTAVLLGDGIFDPLESIKELELSELNLNQLPQNLLSRTMNLEKIRLNHLTIPSNQIPEDFFKSLVHLKTLTLTKTNLQNLSPGIFSKLSNLRTLDLSDNTLPHFPQHIFLSNCDSLQEFIMKNDRCNEEKCVHNLANDLLSDCKNLKRFSYGKFRDSKHIVTIGDHFFGDENTFSELEEIQLHNIELKPGQLHSLFHHLKDLRKLDLTDNDITTIKAKYFPIEDSSNLQRLHLERNPLKCDCDTRKEIRKLNKKIKTVTYHRANDPKECKCNATKVSMEDFFDTDCAETSPCTSKTKTSSSTFVIITLGIITFLLVTILVTIFISERARIWLYHHKIFSKLFPRVPVGDILDNTYDAFISYAEADYEFVERMVQVMENPTTPEHRKENEAQVGGRVYRFCIHQRDWAVGPMIIQNIRDSVKNSYRTIILLSSNFASSQWCEHEFNEAYQENKIIMIMMTGSKISDFDGNELIQQYLRTYTYLKQEDPMLWKKLSYQLPHKSMGHNVRKKNRALRLWRQITEELPLVRSTSRESRCE